MYLIKDELIDNARSLNVPISILSESDAQSIISLMGLRYIDKCKDGIFIWENFIDASHLQDPLGWSYIGNFIGDTFCLIMFYDFDSWVVMRINNGSDLTLLLGESYGFEFYVMDQNLTYVVCFNHHDQLICVGEAKRWLDNLRK